VETLDGAHKIDGDSCNISDTGDTGEAINDSIIDSIACATNLDNDRIGELIERGTIRKVYGTDSELWQFHKGTSGIEAGTVVLCGESPEVYNGFPKIRRALMLDACIKNHFRNVDLVAVEEKMNGYNVRVVRVGGEVMAFTRGGFFCPYTTQKARQLLDMTFFKEHSDLVLHCEMVGPHNPYVPKDVYDVESVAFYIFDIRHKGSGIPLSVGQRHEFINQYDLLSVRLFGTYSINDAAPQIWEIIKRLGPDGREGVVIKDPMMVEVPIKYTCSQSNCTDLAHAFSYYHDYGQDFLYSRVVREGYQTVEWDESDVEFKERCLRLGESMLGSMAETIRKKQHGDDIYEDIQIKTDHKTAREFQIHLRRMGIGVLFKDGVKQEDGEYIFQIKKLRMSTNDKTDSILSGDVW